jgi:multicomponent Na+:H+ antiporter subunit G
LKKEKERKMNDIIIAILATLGAAFTLLSAVGLVRMPDLYLRISASTKAVTLGIGFLLTCTAVYFEDIGVTSRAIAIIFFVVLTAPVGAHLIGRSSYISGVNLWKKTKYDDLKGMYDGETHKCRSGEEGEEEKVEVKVEVKVENT